MRPWYDGGMKTLWDLALSLDLKTEEAQKAFEMVRKSIKEHQAKMAQLTNDFLTTIEPFLEENSPLRLRIQRQLRNASGQVSPVKHLPE